MIKDKIQIDLQKSLEKINVKDEIPNIEPPGNFSFGDYSTNIALKLGKTLRQNPLEVAQKIIDNLPENSDIEKVELLKPGFINFWLKKEYLIDELKKTINDPNFAKNNAYENKKVMVEYTDPNPFKEFHIGHLYSNIVGEAFSRLFEAMGAEVKRANYEGDVGMHVAKSIYGMQKKMALQKITIDELKKKTLNEKVKFMGEAYALGSRDYDENEIEKEKIKILNKKIYELATDIKELYTLGRQWTLEYFETIYKRLGTRFDYYYFEREIGNKGLQYVKENLAKGIFQESEGAVIFPGDKYGLHTRVFINSQGLPTYEAKDLGLAPTKYADFPYDLSIMVTGNEINEYFKVVLKALELIDPQLREKIKHISHGMVRLPEGKMSSRTGKVLTGEWLIETVKKKVQELIKTSSKITSEEAETVAEIITIGAIKYSLIKNNIGRDVIFNINESLALDGNSGPYLQYTYARCQSILKKGENTTIPQHYNVTTLQPEEIDLLRMFVKFPDVVCEAGKNFAPNFIATHLYDLAQRYNLFYQKHSVLQADEEIKQFRLLLTKATAQILTKGLNLLGIKTVERM